MVVALLVTVIILATRQTDLIYDVGASVLFFALCMAYAAWRERL